MAEPVEYCDSNKQACMSDITVLLLEDYYYYVMLCFDFCILLCYTISSCCKRYPITAYPLVALLVSDCVRFRVLPCVVYGPSCVFSVFLR